MRLFGLRSGFYRFHYKRCDQVRPGHRNGSSDRTTSMPARRREADLVMGSAPAMARLGGMSRERLDIPPEAGQSATTAGASAACIDPMASEERVARLANAVVI